MREDLLAYVRDQEIAGWFVMTIVVLTKTAVNGLLIACAIKYLLS